ncbi:MAG: hypothetical protein KDK36_17660, partial [Leptospiraceae bacterium]|nr:hypothetical protein [Leptospiraceae bacterium]
ILLKGELKRDLTTVLKKIKKIKESEFMGKEFNKMKVKSAWLPPENFESDNSLISTIPGVTNLKRLSSLAYFEVSEYSWPDLVSISEHSKKQIKVTINNSSGIQLPSLNLIVKYEGRKGTPAPKFNHINIPSLKNGESKEIILDKVYIVQYTKVSSEDFSIYSVELTGQGSKVLVNLQVPVKNKFE